MKDLRYALWAVGVVVVAILVSWAFSERQPVTPQDVAVRLQPKLEHLRGLKFKHPVPIQEQSAEEYSRALQAEFNRVPQQRELEKVLRMVGLLASDETFNAERFVKNTVANPNDAHYDAESGRVLLLKKSPPFSEGLRDLYAHELYHALQDQHFNLKTYLPEQGGKHLLNDDELLARRAVVEGEAMFAGVLYRAEEKLGHTPSHSDLLGLESLRKETDVEMLHGLLNDPRARRGTGARRLHTPHDPNAAPDFFTNIQKRLLRDGMMFVYTVHERGWDTVSQLYKESPPVSTSQILHPYKWMRREQPVKIKWPDFEKNTAFKDWECLSENVLGELQWMAIFQAQHLSLTLSGAPKGWNGDRYAVFKRRGGEDLMMLVYTVWDDEHTAKRFGESYSLLVQEKYPKGLPPLRIVQQNERVVIVEGGDQASIEAFMAFAQSAEESTNTENVEL